MSDERAPGKSATIGGAAPHAEQVGESSAVK
jgi:hypothetical protein